MLGNEVFKLNSDQATLMETLSETEIHHRSIEDDFEESRLKMIMYFSRAWGIGQKNIINLAVRELRNVDERQTIRKTR